MTTAHLTYPEVRLRLPCEPASAKRGRTVIRLVVASWRTGMDSDQLDVLELLTSELVTNSLLHACSFQHDLTAIQDALGVRVAVTDGELDRPVLLTDEHPSVLGGRGLVLVHAYADDWGVEEFAAGKAIWFRLNTSKLDPPQPTLLPRRRL